jgi:hypothetical protein
MQRELTIKIFYEKTEELKLCATTNNVSTVINNIKLKWFNNSACGDPL